MIKIGVLALQGAFIEHENILTNLGVQVVEIRNKSDLSQKIDGLILPGGESTAIGKLLRELDLFDAISHKIDDGLFVFGTCAGLILLAKNIQNDDRRHFAKMDITVVRNGYGRQLGSFYTEEDFKSIGLVPMTFIRAPYISEVGEGVDVLATVDGKIVSARQNHLLVTSFHPELDTTLIHEYFIKMIKGEV